VPARQQQATRGAVKPRPGPLGARAPDRLFAGCDGGPLTVPGRSLLLVRTVGHLTTTPTVQLPDGREAPQGILDGIVTSLIRCTI
jgi:malate synthase